MTDFQIALQHSMRISEGIAALASILFYKKIKDSYYKYFSLFLILIFCCELFGKYGSEYISYSKNAFYNYFVIPLEFIFLYWLYAYKSLKNKKLFWIFTAIFLLSYIPNELFFLKNKQIFSFNYTFGSLLLMFLVVMEYYKQINSDNILNFAKNRMFYINLGVTLFYIGTLPFWTFYFQLLEHKDLWDLYFNYFLISGIMMYLLFASSFIWGKQNYS
ncbi:hypothetical protein [Chryseobacterium sp. NKUCC03_KSP]|uniref:hypothetical protein n=1 Tax=Chryseobacterium sp. NKUCC03_KSP TaxID=2842125 RepID=UPI00214ACD68|nr:hypothetical protein [Chryseobacterium sp. NKUCC03_KSP]